MFINLNRRSRVTPGGQLPAQSSFLPDAVHPEAPPNVSPYSLFYPQKVLQKITLLEDALNPTKHPSVEERNSARLRKKAFFLDQKAVFDVYKKGNLSVVHRSFMQVTEDDASLTREGYWMALSSLGVTDEALIKRTFELFDVRKEGIVAYKEVISALDVILNGTNKHITSQDCFKLIDTSNCGYILKNPLQDIRMSRQEENGVCHLMVKRLIETVNRLQAPKPDTGKKGKKKKKKKAKKGLKLDSITGGYKKVHISFPEFEECLQTDPKLVQAFLAPILTTMETVYARNKKSTAAMLQQIKPAA